MSTATGLATDEVHWGDFHASHSRFSTVQTLGDTKAWTAINSSTAIWHETDSQKPTTLMCEQHVLTVTRIESRNSTLLNRIMQTTRDVAGDWVWVYNTAANPTRCTEPHGRQSAQGETLALLDGALQGLGGLPDTSGGFVGQTYDRGKTARFGPLSRHV